MPRLQLGALCLLLVLRMWQCLSLAPLSFSLVHGARCHRLLTAGAVLQWLILLSISPQLLHQSVALYEATNVKHSLLFRRIALATMTGDVSISLVLLGTHIWQRQRLAKLLNDLARLQHRVSLSWPVALLLWTKLILSWYELLCNVPFLQQNAARLPWLQLLAYGIQLYVQHVSSVFGNGVFCALLLIRARMRQLELQWQQLNVDKAKSSRLLRSERRLLQLCEDFISVFQLGIFLLLIGNFVNILANMYAYMSYFVQQHGIPLTISNYCLIVTIQLYATILVAHLCQSEHSRLRHRCLELCSEPLEMDIQEVANPTPLLLWPLGSLKISILGLFTLDNAFCLFLVSYAVNFIVIILQFTLEHMKR